MFLETNVVFWLVFDRFPDGWFEYLNLLIFCTIISFLLHSVSRMITYYVTNVNNRYSIKFEQEIRKEISDLVEKSEHKDDPIMDHINSTIIGRAVKTSDAWFRYEFDRNYYSKIGGKYEEEVLRLQTLFLLCFWTAVFSIVDIILVGILIYPITIGTMINTDGMLIIDALLLIGGLFIIAVPSSYLAFYLGRRRLSSRIIKILPLPAISDNIDDLSLIENTISFEDERFDLLSEFITKIKVESKEEFEKKYALLLPEIQEMSYHAYKNFLKASFKTKVIEDVMNFLETLDDSKEVEELKKVSSKLFDRVLEVRDKQIARNLEAIANITISDEG